MVVEMVISTPLLEDAVNDTVPDAPTLVTLGFFSYITISVIFHDCLIPFRLCLTLMSRRLSTPIFFAIDP